MVGFSSSTKFLWVNAPSTETTNKLAEPLQPWICLSDSTDPDKTELEDWDKAFTDKSVPTIAMIDTEKKWGYAYVKSFLLTEWNVRLGQILLLWGLSRS